MNVQLHSTTKIVEFKGVPARIWEGITDNGVKVHAFITRIAHDENEPEDNVDQFKKDLQECRPPSPEIAAFPLRMVL